MTSLFRWVKRFVPKASSHVLRFPKEGFEIISSTQMLEEEIFEGLRSGLYYPVTLGQIFASRYQVAGKLGFGRTSTVWLARDLQ